MADKEVNLFIVDLGKSMGQRHNGRSQSDLDWSIPIVWDKIAQIVSTGRKLLFISVVGFRTNETKNTLAESGDEDYQNIFVQATPQQFLAPQIKELKQFIRPSKTDQGDAISAIVVAISMITTFCRQLKYKKRIFLLTNARGHLDGDEDGEIKKQLIRENISLNILGVDFDDPSFGFKEENKDSSKRRNEQILNELAAEANGTTTTIEKALSLQGIPLLKAVRPVVLYKGTLTLGNIDKYPDASMSIDVEQWPCVMQAKPQTMKVFGVQSDGDSAEGTAQSSATMQLSGLTEAEETLTGLKRTRAYQIEDPDAPGGKRDVDKEQLERGFEYGRTAVHISEGDMEVVKLDTEPSLEVVGFVEQEKFERYFEMGRTNFIGAAKGNEKYGMALSSFIHGLIETSQYAIARHVVKEKKAPLMIVLAPYTEEGFEALITAEIPFAEDMRMYKFPPLDRVVTVGGKHLFQHRTLPTEDLLQAMSDFVDSMDLSTLDTDETGAPIEFGAMQNTYNPVVHRVNQVIQYRGIHGDEPLPKPYDVLLKYEKPPQRLVDKSQSALNAVIKKGDVKKVPPRQKGGFKRRREQEKPLSGLDIDSLLSGTKRQRISVENAIPEFKQLLARSEELSTIQDASQQMGAIIEGYIRNSVGDHSYPKAIEALRVLRDESEDLEMPELYNNFIRGLKGKILGEQLNGERREMWYLIRINKLGLLEQESSEGSKVTPSEAIEFYKASAS